MKYFSSIRSIAVLRYTFSSDNFSRQCHFHHIYLTVKPPRDIIWTVQKDDSSKKINCNWYIYFPGLTGSWIYNKSQSISSSITLPECQIYVSVLVFVVDGIWLWPKTDCLTAYLDCRARGSGPCKRRTMPMPAAKQCIKTDHKRVQQNTYTKQEKSHQAKVHKIVR